MVCTSRHDNDGIECGLQSRGLLRPRLPPRRHRRARTAGDWPSYNKTLTSERYSQLSEINTKNVGKLKVLCTYDVDQFAAFESGLIMVDNALIGTTEFDIFSLNPATCAENWRTHEDYPPALLPANRGAAYLDGMLFRGTQDGRVLAYDFKTGKRIWETTIADPKRGESVPSAPIAWDGLVFVGNAGGDFKGGKGHMFALDAKTGKIVWEFFLVPKVEGDAVRGPLGATPLDSIDLEKCAGHTHQRRRDLDVLHARPENRAALRPRRQSGARLRDRRARGRQFLSPTRSSCSTPRPETTRIISRLCRRTGTTGTSPTRPILIQTMGGKQLMAVAPKDGYLYGFDLATNSLLYRVPVTRVEDVAEAFSPGKDVHFCPGSVGGAEWNSPAYDPQTNLILVGEVDWCDTVTSQSVDELRSVAIGQPWVGMATWNPFDMFGEGPTEGHWAGWVYAVDADTGVWKWRLKSNYPIVGGMTPTAGGVVFFGDVGGNFYALDAANGQKLWGQDLGGAIGGGVITYTANGAQKVAVAAGFTNLAWPTKIVTAKIVVLGLDGADAKP